jgi:hypothetical protein
MRRTRLLGAVRRAALPAVTVGRGDHRPARGGFGIVEIGLAIAGKVLLSAAQIFCSNMLALTARMKFLPVASER